HGEVYRTRPHRRWITEYYLWISFGGALGGISAGVVAPIVFNTTYEYPLLLATALLILPAMFEGGWKQFVRNVRPALIAATILAICGLASHVKSLLGVQMSPQHFAAYLVVPIILMLFMARRLVRYF